MGRPAQSQLTQKQIDPRFAFTSKPQGGPGVTRRVGVTTHGSPTSSATSSAAVEPPSYRLLETDSTAGLRRAGARVAIVRAPPHGHASRPQRGRVGNGAAAVHHRIRAIRRLPMALTHPNSNWPTAPTPTPNWASPPRTACPRTGPPPPTDHHAVAAAAGPARCSAVTNYSQVVTNYSLTPKQGYYTKFPAFVQMAIS